MAVQSYRLRIETQGFCDAHDLTPAVQRFLAESGLRDGVATVFVPGSTAGVTTIEFESGAVSDLREAVERLAPEGIHYAHDARWGDGNGFSHVRAALLGPSLALPFSDGELLLGTWQQVILLDFDNGPRSRKVLVQVVGE